MEIEKGIKLEFEVGHQCIAENALENLRNRLLDLTGRNGLINFRHTKRRSLRIIDEMPNQLVETLLSEKEMRFEPVPEPTRDQLIEAGYINIDEETGQEVRILKDPSAKEWGKYLGLSTNYEVPVPDYNDDNERHTDGAIQTLLYPYELESKLKNLLHLSESAVQEMGANILYLSFGFLEWYDTKNDNSKIAPLFLVPVRLIKGRLNPHLHTYEFMLNYSGEDLIPNLSLKEKLRADFALVLPDLDENTSPEEYFQNVLELIQTNQPKWSVRRYITLTLLNFSKLLMYLDLDPSHWPEKANIINHPLVANFLDDYDPDNGNDDYSEGILGFGEEHLIDELDDIHIKYPLIDDADSSQHSALIDAVDGKNIVIEGPPGTGKSQTISNLIAACLSQKKKVLFVAEKQAALEVVKRRLDAVGLGEFCLELHSHKSQKRKILDEVETRLNKHRNYRKPNAIEIDIRRLEDLKRELKEYAEKINGLWKNTEKTIHNIFMSATRYRRSIKLNPTNFHPEDYNGENFDASEQKFVMDQVQGYQRVYQAVAGQLEGDTDLKRHPWFGLTNGELQIFDIDKVIDALNNWQNSLQNLIDTSQNLSKNFNCQSSAIPNSVSGLTTLWLDLANLPKPVGEQYLFKLPSLTGSVLNKGKAHLEQFSAIQKQYSDISEKIGRESIMDLSKIDVFLKGNKQLNQLVKGSVSLCGLENAINRLSTMQNQLSDLNDLLFQITEAIGNDVSKVISPSFEGLHEFKNVIDLVISLKPSYWKLRDERFDNDEMDELLPLLREDLTNLLLIQNDILGVFKIQDLPNSDELMQLKETVEKGGFFRGLKPKWRAAKTKVLALADNETVSFQQMKSLLEKAAMFSDQLYKIEDNSRYQEVFGDLIQGENTDLRALEALRTWYKNVRTQYGLGFGAKVSLGSAILHFPNELAKGLRSLYEQGVQSQITDILDDFKTLKSIFAPVAQIHNDATILTGSEGFISWLLSSLKKALEKCEPLTTDKSISIIELTKRIELLSIYKEAVAEFEKNDFDDKYFEGTLGFKPGVDDNESFSFALFENIISIAEYLECKVKNKIITEYILNNPTMKAFENYSLLSKSLEESLDFQKNTFDKFKRITDLNEQNWIIDSGVNLNSTILKNQRAIENKDALQNWLDYLRIRNQLSSLGLSRLLNQVEQGDISITQIEEAYQAGIYDLLAREIFREEPELAKFSGYSQNALQTKFKEYDNKLKKLQCELIAWKIDQTDIPSGQRGARVSEHTDLFLLRHECSKKTRHLPIRQLLLKAGRALLAIKPCFMMGPMSVAQYLAPGQFNFDLIVMDEASQIKPQDALGAIARGVQLVVVGDPKQLPPTSFFDRVVNSDEEDPTAIEESESILDATLPIFPSRRLRWHYRSQHENLIAFSNHSFYKSDMVLFPSPNKEIDGFGLKYVKVFKGCFVNRRNIREAQAISEAVKTHLENYPNDSIGVVAMSSEQRLQIEREIETNAKDDHIFQLLLEKNSLKEEPLFIKNLENVQGDERDVILISMTYGPQEPGGKVYQRFGPINSDVGWRRLNVLFTRSKKRMQIFSSMGSEDVIVSSNSKRGVKALRDFLSFCETGILHKIERDTGRPPDSDFEIAVMDALYDEGFECIPQVGVAGFFIDLAVLDPGNPGRYLMGIECDGATYHSAKSVRDRDRLRQTILERLGWNIKRIWSTDWFKNPDGELQPIIRELNTLKSEKTVPTEEKHISTQKDSAIEESENQDETIEFITEQKSLKETLLKFDNEIIRKALPDTPEQKRLLRPAMLEAFLEYTPCSKSEFLEYMPSYLRQATLGEEGKFLKDVLEIVNANVEAAV